MLFRVEGVLQGTLRKTSTIVPNVRLVDAPRSLPHAFLLTEGDSHCSGDASPRLQGLCGDYLVEHLKKVRKVGNERESVQISLPFFRGRRT
jgi:hypothetical protein